jgi:serine/threonine-protein kinase HipA
VARRKVHAPLAVLINNRRVGRLDKQPGGAVAFAYDEEWLAWEHALPVSLSMPLREERYTGAKVDAVFDNLLPDAEHVRRRVAERVGAEGIDAYSLLSVIGRDCVGALQFLPDGDDAHHHDDDSEPTPLDDDDVARLIAGLARAPLGVDAGEDADFRISVAGAQEKTALFRQNGRWFRPHGRTPTTHILKPQIGAIESAGGTIDLSNSVENEFYCLTLLRLFGLETANVEIAEFGGRKVLVVERFDRLHTTDGRLIRLPQEDCCQALSVPPTRKYQSEGGPGVIKIAGLLKGSDTPLEDQRAFLKSQLLFWLIGAPDGHAKNFSVFLTPGGRYRLAPLYDVLTGQPAHDAGQIRRNRFKLAMSVGGHYRMDEIAGRHFAEAAARARIAPSLRMQVMNEVRDTAASAFNHILDHMPAGFPEQLHVSVRSAAEGRLRLL